MVTDDSVQGMSDAIEHYMRALEEGPNAFASMYVNRVVPGNPIREKLFAVGVAALPLQVSTTTSKVIMGVYRSMKFGEPFDERSTSDQRD